MPILVLAISLIFAAIHAKDLSVASTDFSVTLAALKAKRALWIANGVTDYAYKVSQSCYCLPCYIADRYIVIEDKTLTSDGTPKYVEFDSTSFMAQNNNCSVQTPLDEHYKNISYYYDMAIDFLQPQVDADCDANNSCQGSVEFTYHSTLYYPLSINIEWTACGAACDAFTVYNIGCLTVINSDTKIAISSVTHTNSCDNFTFPSPGLNNTYSLSFVTTGNFI